MPKGSQPRIEARFQSSTSPNTPLDSPSASFPPTGEPRGTSPHPNGEIAFRSNSLYRAILDAIPHMALIVDGNVTVLDCNKATEEILGNDGQAFVRRRSGEVLSCIHSFDVPEGCGHGPHCSSCVIRKSVNDCLEGNIVRRRRTKAQLIFNGVTKDFELLVTASPFVHRSRELALLILEDISEISTLRNLIPICAKCKKIRGDDQYWRNVEQYFTEHLGVDFSHGLCPDCYSDTLGEWVRTKK